MVRSGPDLTPVMWDARRPPWPLPVGLFGFVETGRQPVPYAVLSVVAEALAVLAVGVWAVRATPGVIVAFVTSVTHVPQQ